jgi:hypothetical protein
VLCCVAGAILGATIVASQAGELINNFTVAVQSQGAIGAVELAKAIVPYPTHTEAIKYCCNQYNIQVSARACLCLCLCLCMCMQSSLAVTGDTAAAVVAAARAHCLSSAVSF